MSEREWPFRTHRDFGEISKGYEITCAKCRDTDLVPKGECGPTHPSIAKKFQRAGWSVGATPAGDLCPSCSTKPKRVAAVKMTVTPPPLPPPPPPAQITTAGTPSPPIGPAIAELGLILTTAYDHATRTLKDGWSDEKLAAKTGLSLKVVETHRATYFGPLAPPDSFPDDLGKAVAGIGEEITSMRRFSDDLGVKIAALEKRQMVLVDLAGKARTR